MFLFFDVDGTLWDSHNFIPDNTRRGIKMAQEKGHKCFINTGRARAFVHNEDLLSLGFDGIVSSCGCMIEYEGKILYNRLIEKEDCVRTLESVRKNGLKPILEGPNYLYMDKEDFYGDKFGEKVIDEMGDRLLGIRDNWGNWEMSKLSCDTRCADAKTCYEELGDIYDYMIHNDAVVEMVPKGFNKGTGILKVCELLGGDPKETFSFGDSINDKEMLETAAVGVAMGNAPDAVKELADHVTAHFSDDGLFKALLHFDLI
ncbi:MAG: HAD family hydrolase [Butyrivibrio sp.]|nr:HAD family hydrolase [Butyrivibrio sp.]